MTDTPFSDQQLADRIAEVIRPRMLIGLQDAELCDAPGTERINEWADSISRWAAEVVQPEVDRLRAENAQYEALDLGDPDGRISASCNNGAHPTWLRLLTDTRGCPWCEMDESRALVHRIASQSAAEEDRLRAELKQLRADVGQAVRDSSTVRHREAHAALRAIAAGPLTPR